MENINTATEKLMKIESEIAKKPLTECSTKELMSVYNKCNEDENLREFCPKIKELIDKKQNVWYLRILETTLVTIGSVVGIPLIIIFALFGKSFVKIFSSFALYLLNKLDEDSRKYILSDEKTAEIFEKAAKLVNS